jgi:hypothetical protein
MNPTLRMALWLVGGGLVGLAYYRFIGCHGT